MAIGTYILIEICLRDELFDCYRFNGNNEFAFSNKEGTLLFLTRSTKASKIFPGDKNIDHGNMLSIEETSIFLLIEKQLLIFILHPVSEKKKNYKVIKSFLFRLSNT